MLEAFRRDLRRGAGESATGQHLAAARRPLWRSAGRSGAFGRAAFAKHTPKTRVVFHAILPVRKRKRSLPCGASSPRFRRFYKSVPRIISGRRPDVQRHDAWRSEPSFGIRTRKGRRGGEVKEGLVRPADRGSRFSPSALATNRRTRRQIVRSRPYPSFRKIRTYGKGTVGAPNAPEFL